MELRYLSSLSRRAESLNHQLVLKSSGQDTWKVSLINKYDHSIPLQEYTKDLSKTLIKIDEFLDIIEIAR